MLNEVTNDDARGNVKKHRIRDLINLFSIGLNFHNLEEKYSKSDQWRRDRDIFGSEKCFQSRRRLNTKK